MKCKNCGKPNASYLHNDGEYVCDDCLGEYFSCPDCGFVFDRDDYVNGDQGNGYCSNCAENH